MLLLETTIFYLLLGIGVAVAVYVRSDEQPGPALAFQLAGACLFWPLFVPMLLSGGERPSGEPAATERPSADEPDALATAIGQVEAELDAALDGLDGWAEDVLSSEAQRLAELRTAWKLQAERIRQLDHLLAQPTALGDSLAAVGADVHRAQRSESLRQENLRQLRELRNKLHADLVGTLAWVRELVTMIHLARFSGAPAARAEELVAQIAAAVQGLSEVSAWREEDEPAHAVS
jgi:hypothetical protein